LFGVGDAGLAVVLAADDVKEDLFEGEALAGVGGSAGSEAGLDAGAEFVEGAVGDDVAAVDDGDVGAEALDDFEDVRGEEDGGAAGDHVLKHGLEGVGGDGVDAFEGLVEEEDFGAVDDGGGEGEFFAHAMGVVGDELFGLVGEAHELEEFGGALGGGGFVEAVHAADEVEVFAGGEFAEESHAFGDDADMAFDVDGIVEEVFAEDLDGAGGGSEEAGEHFDSGGFAGAVGTEEAEELAGFDDEIDVVDGGEAVEGAGERVCSDGGGHGEKCNAGSRESGVVGTARIGFWDGESNGNRDGGKVMAMKPIVGLHHVTAIASDPQANLDFYTEVLGLRFVKRTVNFDDPGTYHFYFGDDAGAPGTIITFFPWPRVGRGSAGAGEVTHAAFSVPLSAIEFWHQRLTELGVLVERTGKRFDEEVLTLADPDGMKLELVGHADADALAPGFTAPRFADVPAEFAIRGFFGVTMLQIEAEETAKTLAVMGFAKVREEGNRLRFAAPGVALGNHIDVVVDAHANFGRSGAGSVHHIAFRATDDEAQKEWRAEIGKHVPTTAVLDRDYFYSIYFREPGGVLFELATDNPGFATDEPVESLGERLCLPEWLEERRPELEQRLAPLTLHKAKVQA
jgi:glyoxalase family protein